MTINARGETDHCRSRLVKYCQGQGIDLGCGLVKIKVDAIGLDLYHPNADMRKDARVMDFFPTGHFNYVYSSHLLEELENTEATLKEWLRILKDGGYLVLYQADKELYYPLGDPKCNPMHKHHFGWEDLWKIFDTIGGVELVHHDKHPELSEWSFELVVRKKGGRTEDVVPVRQEKPAIKPTDLKFKIMVVGWQAENYIGKCLEYLKIQDYSNWEAQVILDPGEDKTYENALKAAEGDPRIKVKLNTERKYNVANFLEAARLLNPSDEDVLVQNDADDWMAGSYSLSTVKAYYDANPNLLITHGSWQPYPKPAPTNNFAYTEGDFKNNVRKAAWRASHLRTCKYKVWKHIKEESLKDADGKFFTVTGDLALMYPMLEMAGFHRVQFIPEVLYIYNQETPFSDDKLRLDQQMRNTNYIASMKPYEYRETF